ADQRRDTGCNDCFVHFLVGDRLVQNKMTAGGGGKREAIQAFQLGPSDRYCKRFPERPVSPRVLIASSRSRPNRRLLRTARPASLNSRLYLSIPARYRNTYGMTA